MGDVKGFLKFKRQNAEYRPVCERIRDYREVAILPPDKHIKDQASRCMDCGTPFCHWACPIGNYIPEWNDMVFHGRWQKAYELLEATNNFPEITGRICPALCEYSCVLGINDDPVTVRENEFKIIEQAFSLGYVKSFPASRRTDKEIAVVGSGPAGLACADQLAKAGHNVVVFEKDDKIGGILRYGIPDFKLDKSILERRIKILKKRGIKFITSVDVGKQYPVTKLRKDFDAVCLAGGSRLPRDLNIDGRNLKGIYFAMDYLIQSNRRVAGEIMPLDSLIDAKDKKVVVIGGGDTGADCVGTAHRQGAACVVQIEIMPKPESCRTEEFPWPRYPLLLKTSTSHQEGGSRDWSVLTKKFSGEKGSVRKLICVKVNVNRDTSGCPVIKEIPGTEFEVPADMVVLAMGFLHPEHSQLVNDLGVALDKRGNIATDQKMMTSVKGVFACGDMHIGQSLVVWAISEGRTAAYYIDRFLMGRTSLPLI